VNPAAQTARMRVVVLASGSGTLAQALMDAAKDPQYPAQVVAVISDRADAAVLARAEAARIPWSIVELGDHRDDWNQRLVQVCTEHSPDWIVSAGFMRLLGESFLAAFPHRILNTHPALLPAFPGAHGVRDALKHGVKVTGTTVHLVDSGLDSGPILAQQAIEVLGDDDVESLHERIKVVERELLVRTVARLARGTIAIEGRRVRLS
jgi:phosphoribosylglycinamide formyltransferase 1